MGVVGKGAKRSAASNNKSASSKKAKISQEKAKKIESESSEEESSESESESSEEESSEDESSDEEQTTKKSSKVQSDESEDELDFSDSEDELDKDEIKIDEDEEDQDDEDVEGEDDEENGEPKTVRTQEEKQESRAKQRQALQDRKLARKSGVQVQHIKSLWERLRVKNPPVPKEIREKLSNEIWDLSKDVITDLVLKHDASRVVQTLVKYSTKERREQVTFSLKGHFYELATSAYGKYLLVKLLHYGSKASRELILSELHGKLRKLMRHREGAYVVEDLYVLYASSEQKKQMIKEFWGAEYAVFQDVGKGKSIKEVCDENVEKRTVIQRNLISTITASVEKGSTGFQILHAAMRDYVQIMNEEETREFIELLTEQVAELIHTPEGSEVACTIIARATAKERKKIISNLKEHVIKVIENEHGNLVIITLLLTTDDTKGSFKPLLAEFNTKFNELIVNKYSRRPFLYLLNDLDGRYFSPIVKKELNKYIELSKETSKKPHDQRRKEFLAYFSPMFYDWIIKDPESLLGENMGAQFVADVFLNNAPITDDKREAALSKIIEALSGDIDEEESLINRPFSVRLLKSLIQSGKWDAKEKKLIKLELPGLGAEFGEKFYQEVIGDNLKRWINNKNLSFVIVALYEALDKKSDFNNDLKNLKKVVKSAASDENKGAQLLVKLTGF